MKPRRETTTPHRAILPPEEFVGNFNDGEVPEA